MVPLGRPKPRSLRTWLLASAGVGMVTAGAQARTVVHLKKTVWGCVNPAMAAIINDDSNPGRYDPAWVARISNMGECVTISPRSVWEPLTGDRNGFTYIAYRGTTAKPGSFWVPTADLVFPPPEPAASPPATVTSEPLSPPAAAAIPPPIATPASAPAQPDVVPPQPLAVAPEQPSAHAVAAPLPGRQPASEDGGSGVGWLIGLGIIVLSVFLSRSGRKRKDIPAAAKRTAAKPKPAAKKAELRVALSSRTQINKGNPPRESATSVPVHATTQSVESNFAATPASSAAADREASAAQKVRPNSESSRIFVPSVAFKINSSSLVQIERKKGPKTKPSTGPVWHPPGEAVQVAGHLVADGMIYVGRSPRRFGDVDGCFVDPGLPVASSALSAGSLGYWPSYAGITPECRRAYLEWLAAGKRTPRIDIGYVFLYFYGLERRLFVERPPAEEVGALVAEVERLRGIYADNRSFDGYSRRLIDAAATLYGVGAACEFVADLGASPGEMALSLKVAIGREVAAGRALGFELAVAGLLGLHDFYANHRATLDSGRAVFLDVLRPRFQAAFPNGFELRNHKDARLDLHYKGAAAGLMVDLAAKRDLNLPDPSKLPWTKLLDLGRTAAVEIEPHVKMLVHHPEKSDSLVALLTCPPELARTTAVDARRWIEVLPSPAAVGFGELARHAIGAAGTKWTIRQHRQVAEALAKVGRGMEPDPEDATEHLASDTVVYTFTVANASSPRTREFKTASAAALLVAGIAASAAGSTELVERFWLQHLSSRLSLNHDETVRLGARLARLRGSGFSLAKIKHLLAEATHEEREFCAWSATVAAGATGTIGKTQVAMLETIYDTLGVPRGSLYAGLHAGLGAATVAADGPVDVAKAVPEILHPVPPPPVAEPAAHAQDKLASVRAETERVSALLADVFREEEPAPASSHDAQEGPLVGLDADHSALVRQLLARAEWSRAKFDEAAVATGLMPGGAMEAINEWAFDRHGNALLEDGDPVLVNAALLQGEVEAVGAAE